MKITSTAFVVISLCIGALAIAMVVFHDTLATRMDNTFLALLGFAFLLFVLPWEQIRSFKAAGVEVTLERPEVVAAISGLGLDRVADARLRESLERLDKELKAIRGSRVLWIDNKPHTILAARRLLRALGIGVTSAVSSEMANEILEADNDFDLIITDVQRRGESYRKVPHGVDIHEGVNNIVLLRQHDDPNIRALPVIFYAAYDWERLVEFTRPARELTPEAEISNSNSDFFTKLIHRLVQERAKPIWFSKDKIPTPVD